MPTYLYRCRRGHEFEVEQRITDAPLKLCDATAALPASSAKRPGFPKCGEPVRRLIPDGTSFTLKGPGWAKDGYK